MATITSTIRLVDQMSPTLNKISNSINRVNAQTKSINKTSAWTNFASGVRRATTASTTLYASLRRILYTLMALRSLKVFVDVADTMMNATARLNNINDGLLTTSQYVDMIYASAQRSRGSFSGMLSSVSKLGTIAGSAFNGSVNEMVAFVELMNKLFVVSGASAAESSNAMYQLTQAMASGRLQGDEMRSILENAPLLAQKIANKLGVSIGELKKLGAEGKITADVIKEALFDAADEIEDKFNAMPKTIGQVWTDIKNRAINAFRPVIDRVQKLLNTEAFAKVLEKLDKLFTSIANGILKFITRLEDPAVHAAIKKVYDAFHDVWKVIKDIGIFAKTMFDDIFTGSNKVASAIKTLISVYLAYKAVLIAINAIQLIALAIANWQIIVIGAFITSAILWISKLVNKINEHFGRGGDVVSALGIFIGALGAILAIFWDLTYFGNKLFELLASVIAFVGLSISTYVGGAVKWVIDTMVIMWKFLKVLVNQIWGYITTFGSNTKTFFENLWNTVWHSSMRAFWNFASNFLEGVYNITLNVESAFRQMVNNCINVLNDLLGFLGFDAINTVLEWAKIDAPSWLKTGIPLRSEAATGVLSLKTKAEDFGLKAFSHGYEIPESLFSGFTKYDDFDIDRSEIDKLIKERDDTWNELTKDGILAQGRDLLWEMVEDAASDMFNWSNYANPLDWYEKGYNIGEGVSTAVGSLSSSLADLIESLSGKDSWTTQDQIDEKLAIKNWSGVNTGSDDSLPDSLKDLLGGYASNGNLGDALKDLVSNTDATSGSVGNIEDTLDLAEEELELLRKLAEQEIINRFTTAEIRVDMTNNNNINSGLDLDGIVTHLSDKLYEELGVVASGVHY